MVSGNHFYKYLQLCVIIAGVTWGFYKHSLDKHKEHPVLKQQFKD